MPAAEEIPDNDFGVDVLVTKRRKRGQRTITKLSYSNHIPAMDSTLPSVNAPSSDKLSTQMGAANLQDDGQKIQRDIDFTILDRSHFRKTMTQQDYIRQFSLRKISFIETILSRYAFDIDPHCVKCGTTAAFYRCRSCHFNSLHCRGCIRNTHKNTPFHRIEHWNGNFFQRAALWQVGLRLIIANQGKTCHCISYQMSIIDGQEIARDATRASRVHSFTKRKAPADHSAAEMEQGNEGNSPEERYLPAVPDVMGIDWGDEDEDLSDTVGDSDDPTLSDDEDPADEDVYDEEDEEDGDRLGKGIPLWDSLGNKFVVIVDSSGMHHLPAVFCKCNFRTPEDRVQDCVFWGLIPASYKTISTLFTQACLDDFRLSNLEAKITPHRYHTYLQRITNPAFPKSVPNRYGELRRLTREWRIMKQEILAGIHMPTGFPSTSVNLPASETNSQGTSTTTAHTASTGIASSTSFPSVTPNTTGNTTGPTTTPALMVHDTLSRGSLALFCPACPQPDINLPANWRLTIDSWLLARHLAMDGNFSADHLRLKGGNTDSWLLDGRGHFTPRQRYQQHLKVAQETRTNAPCEHNFRAIGLGSLTRSDCDITGIGATACARHGCFAPGSVVDFQKGERQMNMDYSLCEAVNNTDVPPNAKVFTWYDIWCQHCIHFAERVQRNPYLSIPAGLTLDGGIGLFHVHGHAEQCFHRFASYFIPGAAIVDGEVLETLWSVLNHISRSTRTATLPHREEILNDAMNDSNWKKWVKMVPRLVHKYNVAVEQSSTERSYWDNLTRQAGGDLVAKWTTSIEKAERERTGVNAQSMDIMKTDKPAAKGRAEVQYELNQANPSTSAETDYITDGLKLEEEQLEVGIAIARMGAYPSKTEKGQATALRNRLLKKIQHFHVRASAILGVEICQLFPEQRPPIPVFSSEDEEGVAFDPAVIPDSEGARPALYYSSTNAGTHAELIYLMLPSGIPHLILNGIITQGSRTYNAKVAAICEMELKLRAGQANDTLQDIRNSISRISFQYTKNFRMADRKTMKTRSRSAIDSLHKAISHCRRVYNLSRSRMIVLKILPEQLASTFKAITNEDVKISTVTRTPNERGTTRQKLSWIFQTEMEKQGETSDENYLQEYLRIHWLRARAMAKRWEEELELVKNEMLWTWICFQKRHISWGKNGLMAEAHHKPGHAAYARKQSFLWQKLGDAANSAFCGVYLDFVAHL